MKSSKFLTTLGLTTLLTVSGVNILPFASTESLVNSSKAEAAVTVSNSYVWMDMPQTGNQDDNWSCGPTSAARVLNFYGQNVNRDTLVNAINRDFVIPPRIKKPWPLSGHWDIRTGTTPHALRDVMRKWEVDNVKLERKADFNKLLDLLRQGKPVVALIRNGSQSIANTTWPTMHWIVIHGFSQSEQKIYFTETDDGRTYPYSYSEFQSKWDWRVDRGPASVSLNNNGVEPKTMIWVDRVPPVIAQSQPPSSSQPVASLNLALDANNGTGNLYLYPNLDSTNNNHLWTITPLSDDYFMIISKRNGYALDANGGTKNLYLHPSPDKRNPNHYWRLTQVGGFYMITSRVNGYALDANGGTRNLYLHPNPNRGNSNHLWKIVDVGSYKAIGSALKN